MLLTWARQFRGQTCWGHVEIPRDTEPLDIFPQIKNNTYLLNFIIRPYIGNFISLCDPIYIYSSILDVFQVKLEIYICGDTTKTTISASVFSELHSEHHSWFHVISLADEPRFIFLLPLNKLIMYRYSNNIYHSSLVFSLTYVRAKSVYIYRPM